MAGRPKLRAAFAALEQRGGVEGIVQELMAGKTIAMIAKELKLDRGYLRKNLMEHPEYGPAIQAAEKYAADAHADAALEELHEVKERRLAEIKAAQEGDADASLALVSQIDIGLARGLANQRNFKAAALNRAKYGTGGQQNVTINIGDMHLDALRKIKVIDHE